LTQQNFLDLFERLLPASYLDSLKSPGPGWELLQGAAKSLERASYAVGRAEVAMYYLMAGSGARATATVTFTRPSIVHGAVTILRGTRLTCSVGGQEYVTLADVAFGAADLGPHTATVQAVANGYEYNQPTSIAFPTGETAPGEIDTIHRLLESPSFGDPTIILSQTTAATGGAPAAIDQLGSDRGLTRYSSEPDSQYRSRIRQLSDTISPAAIGRLLDSLLVPYGITYTLIETWQASYQTCWDAPGTSGPMPDLTLPDPMASAPSDYFDSTLFTYDDPRDPVPFCNRWMDETDYRAAFIVVLPRLPHWYDWGMVYDDTAMNEAAHHSSLGVRGFAAYDIPASTPIKLGFYDGTDLKLSALYGGIWDALQKTKAAGVGAYLEQEGN
jgi:hypothetical protein